MKVYKADLAGGWNTSITTIFGVTPKFTMLCGRCGGGFSKRFNLSECDGRNPITKCTVCGAVNKVPVSIDW